ncbi:MAG: polymer-forming cytoskeletal protein, partial [Actinomycetota bacterium]|nr:polymer-forming cytoskeletal protein [Actinomycetota bacterium]
MRTSVGLFLICALLPAPYLLLSADPAHASDKRVMGDVVVEEGETVEEIHTAWGDVLVKGEVEGDVSSGFGNIEIDGPVGGDVDAGSGNVRINAPVGSDVNVGQGEVRLESGAQIEGGVSHGSGNLHRDPGATIGGVETAGMASWDDDDSPLEVFSDLIGWAVFTSLLVGASVLLTILVPRPLRASARNLEALPGRSLVLGFGLALVVFVFSFLLFVTVVGIPLLLLLWPAYLLLLLFGVIVTAYFLGRKVVLATGRYRAGDGLAAAIGTVLVAVAYLIPFLGGLVFFALALLGTGAAVLALLARRPRGAAPRATYTSYEDYLREHGN